MGTVSTWEERMAERAAQRRVVAEAEEACAEAAEQARLSAEFPAVKGEWDWVETDGPHRGHRRHGHNGHVMCSCGEIVGVGCVAIDPDNPPDPCPVCVARGIDRP
jgi:hypothetical protein